MEQQIDTVIRRTQLYNFEDGLTEVFIGALTILGGLVLLTARFPFIAFGVFLMGVILITFTLERIRERNTYPRSGYITYKEHRSKRWVSLLLVIIGCLVAGGFLIAAFLLDYHHALAWPALIVGVFVGGAFLYKGILLRLVRIIFLGAIITLFGFLFSPIVLGSEATEGYKGLTTIGLFFFSVGVACLISGGWRFRKYLQENPLPVEPNDD
jgi:hypothetical protein